MFKGVKAYLYEGSTVVLDKSHIKNAKDEQFEEVSLYLAEEFIKESYEELKLIEGAEDDYECEVCGSLITLGEKINNGGLCDDCAMD